ncbi:3-hydroxy-3-methylglutaryl-coenzyme A reductase [Schistosoma japonicum]|uniref:3-hydroxy-3-methylglutaryl-coenzyme A reductase n=1 Tax=Schistosoma japonicum TaxID=6182 RepID=A0A4Z2CZY3_SCHJA|nr:3-hydroxy-3-methylglutaryl-coenzyme A reductase [Schistosoma japonicum]
MPKVVNAALLFFDYVLVGTFITLLIYSFCKLCTLLFDFLSLNYSLGVLIYQIPVFITSLIIFAYFIDILARDIDDKISCGHELLARTMLDNRKRLNGLSHILALFTFTLCPIYSAVCVPNISFTVFLLSTSVFLLFSDLSIFIKILEYYLLKTESMSYQHIQTHCLFSYLSSHRLFVEFMLTVFLKISVLSFGMTLKYTYLVDISRFTLMEQIMYIVIMFVFLPSFMRILALYTQNKYKEQRKCSISSNRLFSTIRRRSHSCSSDQSSYEERRPVIMRSFENCNSKPNCLDKHWSVTFVVLISLIILHLNNRHSEHTGSFNHNSSRNKMTSALHHITDFGFTSILRLVYDVFQVIDLNLVGYIFLGLLLYQRVKLNKPVKSQLRNLDLPVVKETLVTDQIKQPLILHNYSEKVDSVPPRSRKRIYCSRKEENHTSENECTSVSTFLDTDKNKNDCPSNVLDLDASITKIKRGLGYELSDTEILQLISHGRLKTRELESVVRNPFRAVELRRLDLSTFLSNPHIIERIPYKDYDYRLVYGQCCEEVIGYIPIPVGKIGPLLLDGRSHYVPLATTEGCLVASTNRGCRAIFLAGGVKSVVYRDQMTRAPVVWFPSIADSVKCIAFIDSEEGFQILKSAFDKTSAHANLLSVFASPAGRYVHIRFAARTGDAMGMNMVSKATDSALHCLQKYFSSMQVISLSGNMCTDKKPATINTILGRGKSVIAEAHIPSCVLVQVLHTNAQRLARLTHAKNWIGSAMAGCPGMMGCNAHAANIIAGMFAATGQDLAQVVDSSSCLTQLEVDSSDDSLIASVTMPCLEVGTIGGGTRLPGQRACLDLLDLSIDRPAEHLSRIIAATVLAAELSLMAALDTDDLVKAHMHFNRAKQSTIPNTCSNTTTTVETCNISDIHNTDLYLSNRVMDNSGIHESVHPIHAKSYSVRNDSFVNSEICHYTM